MKTLARFVVRPASSEGKTPQGDLLLGSMMFNQKSDLLRPGEIHEIREVMGTLMLMPLGKAAIGMKRSDSSLGVCWGNDVNQIITVAPGRFLLTKAEAVATDQIPLA